MKGRVGLRVVRLGRRRLGSCLLGLMNSPGNGG
jgi:hypothetical protein